MEPSEYDNIARLEATHWWYVSQRRIAAMLLRQLPLPRPARILDAGCGVGGGLHWLTEFGTPTGVDLHPRAVAHSARVSARVAQASIQTIPFASGSFDLVTTFEVLYHLAVSDDVGALREMARVLKPGGWLMLRVPAHEWLGGAHDRHVHTRHRYSAREVRQMVSAAGLRLHRLTPVGAFMFPFALLARLAENPTASHTDVTLPSPFINNFLTAAFALEGAWVRRWPLPFGLSLLAIAQKVNGEW